MSEPLTRKEVFQRLSAVGLQDHFPTDTQHTLVGYFVTDDVYAHPNELKLLFHGEEGYSEAWIIWETVPADQMLQRLSMTDLPLTAVQLIRSSSRDGKVVCEALNDGEATLEVL